MMQERPFLAGNLILTKFLLSFSRKFRFEYVLCGQIFFVHICVCENVWENFSKLINKSGEMS